MRASERAKDKRGDRERVWAHRKTFRSIEILRRTFFLIKCVHVSGSMYNIYALAYPVYPAYPVHAVHPVCPNKEGIAKIIWSGVLLYRTLDRQNNQTAQL